MANMKNLPFKKTEDSYVWVYDKFHIISDVENDSGFKIGEARIKIYLEDLGPVSEKIWELEIQKNTEENQIEEEDKKIEELDLEEI